MFFVICFVFLFLAFLVVFQNMASWSCLSSSYAWNSFLCVFGFCFVYFEGFQRSGMVLTCLKASLHSWTAGPVS